MMKSRIEKSLKMEAMTRSDKNYTLGLLKWHRDFDKVYATFLKHDLRNDQFTEIDRVYIVDEF